MNKKLINSIIMILASGVCFFFAIIARRIASEDVGSNWFEVWTRSISVSMPMPESGSSSSSDFQSGYCRQKWITVRYSSRGI